MTRVVAIVVAGGSGTRMGGEMPKQFLLLGGRSILDRSVHAISGCPSVDGIVLALPPSSPPGLRDAYRGVGKVIAVVDGGKERHDSVRHALGVVPEEAEILLVHDAVRPFLPAEFVTRCVELAREHGAVAPVLPIRDTVKEWDAAARTLSTVDRAKLMRVQTPQGFRADILREAYRKAAEEGFGGTDDASIVERSGRPVVPFPGCEGNLKITVPEEYRMASGMLGEEPDFRIGIGGDAHPLAEGRELWLGGVRVDHDRGLVGHSDGDVLLHAVADAVYGAIGDGDIGQHFPPGIPETEGISSRKIIAHARARMIDKGFGLVGLDAVVVCEEPRIGPIAARLRASIAELFTLPEERVSLKGKTTEGMGFEGRREGISAWAVALLRGSVPRP